MLHLAVLSFVDPGGLGSGPRTNVPQQAENTVLRGTLTRHHQAWPLGQVSGHTEGSQPLLRGWVICWRQQARCFI